jgi:hypothetical protein
MVFKLCLPAGDSEGDQRAVARHGKKMLSALTFNMQNGQVWDEENPDQAEVSLSRAIEFLREQSDANCGRPALRPQRRERSHNTCRTMLPDIHLSA